ncbi:hypothetical protein PsalMR5_02820 [Piscirickettsia salmonis]|uniref:hypothetical protein n=1 Tax=Piscirickettsia salmonis TaxID=1238 RepID=UPI0012BB0443|nr:hypothetical protein [Piscirickettsia salmonis]QGP55374.1 hypothetical protein PsalSR1_02819 [Piscirickettsia salmonis]QGP64940.1 hypothetical protein PsalMR5_02820 [Piscirickettsia salmonis]
MDDVKKCIQATGKYRHLFIAFLHNSGFNRLNFYLKRESTGYTEMPSLFFENFTQEARDAVYKKAVGEQDVAGQGSGEIDQSSEGAVGYSGP